MSVNEGSRGPVERVGLWGGKSKRMSQGRLEVIVTEKDRPSEGLVFRVAAKLASSGEIGKAELTSLERLFGPLA